MIADVIIKGEPWWPDFLGTLLVGIGGVVLGVLLTSWFELWRRAVDGQAAARAIRLELMDGIQTANAHMRGWSNIPEFGLSAWSENRVIVAPHLEELDYVHLSRTYSLLDGIRQSLQKPLGEQGGISVTPVTFGDWRERATTDIALLRRLEANTTHSVTWHLLHGRRIATEEEIQRALAEE